MMDTMEQPVENPPPCGVCKTEPAKWVGLRDISMNRWPRYCAKCGGESGESSLHLLGWIHVWEPK